MRKGYLRRKAIGHLKVNNIKLLKFHYLGQSIHFSMWESRPNFATPTCATLSPPKSVHSGAPAAKPAQQIRTQASIRNYYAHLKTAQIGSSRNFWSPEICLEEHYYICEPPKKYRLYSYLLHSDLY